MRKQILKNRKRKAGYMLIEAVIATFIVGIVLVTFLTVMAASYRTEFAKRDIIIASNLAQEEIEIVRNHRDNNWKNGCKAFGGQGLDSSQCSGGGWVFPSGATYRCIDYLSTTGSVDCSNPNSRKLYLKDNFYQYGSSGATATKFSRYFNITGNNDSRRIDVVVTWDGKSITMSDTLYAWGDAN